MDSNDLELILKNFKNYMGVFSKNFMPYLSNIGDFYIINTNCFPCTVDNGHWVVIMKMSVNDYYFFDSFGNSPLYFNINIPGVSASSNIIYSMQQLQSYASNVCGLYCAFFCMYMLNCDGDFSDFLDIFDTEDFTANDLFIKNLFLKLYK